MAKKTIRDIDVKGKKVIVRCDFNVPLNKETGEIEDDTRIVAALPTIKYLQEQGAKIILCSHLGRPKGKVNEKLSLSPVAKRLEELLGTKVNMATDIVGESAKSIADSLAEGGIELLENLRFDPREEANDDTFAMDLASLSDGTYVNDAFGCAHREHASTEGITNHVDEAVAGFLNEKEIEFIIKTLENPKRTLVVVLGGSKVSDKIGVIENLLEKADKILIGGGMAFTFLKAQGKKIGDSICEDDQVEFAKEMLKKAEEKGVEIVLPEDVNITTEFSNDTPDKIVSVDNIPDGYQGLDIGPRTARIFGEKINGSGTVIWNGPLGVCEFPKYKIGTNQVAMSIAANPNTISIVAGGDSIAAIKSLGLEDKFTHLSTGGGATLELLEGKPMPGIACLSDKKEETCIENSTDKKNCKSCEDEGR